MGDQTVNRRLVAIFYADVAGYSRLTGVDEVGTHEALRTGLAILTKAIEPNGGRVNHYAGDAILAEFIAAIREGREPECSGKDNLKSLAIVFAAIQSAEENRTVEIAEFMES